MTNKELITSVIYGRAKHEDEIPSVSFFKCKNAGDDKRLEDVDDEEETS